MNMSSDTLTITLDKTLVKEQGGFVVLDIDQYQTLQRRLETYQQKEKLARNLQTFKSLSDWGESFAKEREITERDVLTDD